MNWRILDGDPEAEDALRAELGIHPLTARLLVQRGLRTPAEAEAFLDPSLARLHDPLLLPDAEKACERLKQALAAKEKILIHGDYDGDGLTSAALWTRTLELLGGDVESFVPHRGRDGYDMRAPSIEQARRDGVRLIVTTDCGIQRLEEVETARELGIDVIVTDHHTPNRDGSLPRAVAVVNPHRLDSCYPFPNLAGVGVAYKVCEALVRYLGLRVDTFRRSCLDLVAIGTVTDVMPLLGENRILVTHGLEVLRATKKPGLKALLAAAGYRNAQAIDAHSIAFGIGPRLNSASRIDETTIALDLLLTRDAAEAASLAQHLDELNAQRKETQAKVIEEAMQQVARRDLEETRCLVVHSEGWPAGIIGLVASRLSERFCRPCVVIGVDEETGEGRGSARSVPAFNMLGALDSCSDLLTEYGGHRQAAGLAIASGRVDAFAAKMDDIARSTLTEEDLRPSLDADAEADPESVTLELIEQLSRLAPFGNCNSAPRFVSRDVRLMDVSTMGKDGSHLCLSLYAEGLNGDGKVRSPWFSHGEMLNQLTGRSSLDICYRPEINEFNGRRLVQFRIEDVRPPEF
jgi:single-stranded-DNA-specific exonuclease